MANALVFSIFAFVIAGTANGLRCYNATAMPDMSGLFSTMMMNMLLANTSLPAEPLLMEANPQLPIDAELLDDCDSCMRMTMRGTMDTASMGADESGMPHMVMKMTFMFWMCNKKDENNTNDGRGGDFFGGGFDKMMGTIGNSDNKNDTCVPFSMRMKIPQIKGAAQVCSCCEDKCNEDIDCGLMSDLFGDEIKAAASFLYPPTTPATTTMDPEIEGETRKWSLKEKCVGLRTAAGFIRDVCGYVNRQPDTGIIRP